MTVQSKHYFHFAFMRNVTGKFKRGGKESQTTELEYVLHLSFGEWQKDFVLRRKIIK